MPVWCPRDADETGSARVCGDHRHEQGVDLDRIADDLGRYREVLAAKPEPDRLFGDEVELPFAAARRQQSVVVADVAERLAVGLARTPPRDEGQHQAAAKRRR